MSWTPIRVSKYDTRELHPDDHQPGLPKPGPLEDESRYERLHVRKEGVTWIGRGYANDWLASKQGYYAEPTETEKASVQAKDKPTRKQRKKRKAV